MRKYEMRTRQVEEKVLVSLTCDLCGREGKGGWNSSNWEVNETELTVTVKHSQGTSYPEGGHVTECCVDMCPQCFKTMLVPWLQEQGAEIHDDEFDW